MTTPTDPKPDLLELAFALIAERGWRRFSLTEVARRADLPLAEVRAELPDRAAPVRALARRADARMLDLRAAELDGLSPRERVFELVMRRLDALEPFKPGLRALARQAPADPGLLAAGACNLARLADRLLDAAETEAGPLTAAVARNALGAVYARVAAVWLDDDTPDLARTLAELDRRLQQAESLARWTRWTSGRAGGRGRGAASPAPDAAAA